MPRFGLSAESRRQVQGPGRCAHGSLHEHALPLSSPLPAYTPRKVLEQQALRRGDTALPADRRRKFPPLLKCRVVVLELL